MISPYTSAVDDMQPQPSTRSACVFPRWPGDGHVRPDHSSPHAIFSWSVSSIFFLLLMTDDYDGLLYRALVHAIVEPVGLATNSKGLPQFLTRPYYTVLVREAEWAG